MHNEHVALIPHVSIIFQMETMGVMIITLLLIWINQAKELIGYDCGSASTNLTTLSLLNTEECDIPEKEIAAQETYIQLLQINEFSHTRVIQCKVEIDRLIKRCGMWSHTMDVNNGKHAYIHEVSRDACERMHISGTYHLYNIQIAGLKSNETTTRPVTLAGAVHQDGSCSGTTIAIHTERGKK